MFFRKAKSRQVRLTEAYEQTQAKRAAKAPKPPEKTPGFLVFSRKSKKAALGRGAGGTTGYKVAVTDNGGAFVCTNFVETKEKAEAYITKYGGHMQQVSDLRIVEEEDGTLVNEGRWKEWRYDPKKCERACVAEREGSNYNMHGCVSRAMRHG